MAKIAIIVKRDPITILVDEDMTEEQITAQVEGVEGFARWDYEDPWRN